MYLLNFNNDIRNFLSCRGFLHFSNLRLSLIYGVYRIGNYLVYLCLNLLVCISAVNDILIHSKLNNGIVITAQNSIKLFFCILTLELLVNEVFKKSDINITDINSIRYFSSQIVRKSC